MATADGKVILVVNRYPNNYNIWADNDAEVELLINKMILLGIDPDFESTNKRYGNRIIIEHIDANGNEYYTLSSHLQQVDDTPVKVGDYVKMGQVIGYMGNTENS